MHREERLGSIEDMDTAVCELTHLVESGLDAVERREHVEAHECDIPRPEPLERAGVKAGARAAEEVKAESKPAAAPGQ